MSAELAVFIVSNRRPNNVKTLRTLERCGYTGRTYILLDDEDETRDDYARNYGSDKVLVFEKRRYVSSKDLFDNFYGNTRTVLFARNAVFDVAEELGLKKFIVLDDDYTGFFYRFDRDLNYNCRPCKRLDDVFSAMADFFDCDQRILCLSIAQGGDFIGGIGSLLGKSVRIKRKAMNLFLLSTERRFDFYGRFNDDVNTYVRHGVVGGLFLTTSQLSLGQLQTQTNPGGLTEEYLTYGTYVKSFYSVLAHPSGVKISFIRGGVDDRIHHEIKSDNTYPRIVSSRFKKK